MTTKVTTNAPMEAYGKFRYGLSECECHWPRHEGRKRYCPRRAKMYDGWFICWRCKRHAPQLRDASR